MTYAEAISTIAIIASAASLWLHWRRYRRDLREKEPEIICTETDIPELPGWTKLTVKMRNRASYSIKADHARVLWPPEARIVGIGAARVPEKDPFNPSLKLRVPDKSFRKMPLRLAVAHAGVTDRRQGAHLEIGTVDTHSTDLLVFSRRSSSVWIRISFTALDKSITVRTRIIKVTTVAPAQANKTQ